MDYDLHHSSKTVRALSIGTIVATTNGDIIDTKTFESIEYIILTGAVSFGPWILVFEHGDEADLADAEVVPAELVLGNVADIEVGENDVTRRVGIISKKRFQRIVLTVISGVANFGVVALLYNAHAAPTAD